MVMRKPVLLSSSPDPTDTVGRTMQWQGAGVSPPQPLVSGVPQHGPTAQEGQKHPGLSLGTLQHDKWYHCPHSHVSPSEGASLGLDGPCRPVHGGVSGAMCCFPSVVPEVPWSTSYLERGCCKFDLALLWTLMGDSGLLRSTCSTEGGALLLQRSWAQTPTVAALPTILPETMEVTQHLMH